MSHQFQQDRHHPGYCVECALPPATEIHNDFEVRRCDQCNLKMDQDETESSCSDCRGLEAREQAEKEYWKEHR